MYFRVPIIHGVLDIDYTQLIRSVAISGDEALVLLRDCEKRLSWVEIDQEEFERLLPTMPPESHGPSLEDRIKATEDALFMLMLSQPMM